MNCPEVVEQVTGGGFPWVVLIVIAIIAGVVVYNKGLLDTATTGRIHAIIAKLRSEADEWEEKLKAKTAKAHATAAATADQIARMNAAQAMLNAGTINAAQYEEMRAAILKS